MLAFAKEQISLRMNTDDTDLNAPIQLFDPCRSVLSVLSGVVWGIVQSPMALLQPERNCDHDEMRSTVSSDVAFWSSGHTYPAIIGCVGKCYNPNRV